jgi:Ca2+-binding RTX toxin-like protein
MSSRLLRCLPLPKLVVAAAAACALLPAAANAASITVENGTLTYRAGAQGVNLLVSSSELEGVTYLSFGAYNVHTDYDPAVCRESQYLSDTVLCKLNPTMPLRIEGSDAKDSLGIFSASSVPDSMPITIDGKGGDDAIKDAYDGEAGRTLLGGAGNDAIEGYGGPDVLDGGDGNDTVDGGIGNDEVHGGAGDDVLWGDHYKSPGADLLDGGPGTDQIDEWTIPSGDTHPQPTVTLDGIADDGRPGEGDNVLSVEKLTFHVNATFVGTDAAETVDVLNVDEGASNLDGGGGNDVLKAYDLNDVVNGGAGDDAVEGGLGNDTVTGGPGKDMIMGDSSAAHCSYLGSCKIPFGNDTIHAQDGEADQVDCGIGTDVAYVDAIDTVNNCETLTTAGASPAPGTGKATPGAGGKGAASGLALVGAAKLKALRGGKLSVGVPCAAACRVSVVAKAGRKTVATGKATLLAAGTAKVKLKVARRAQGSLKRAKRLKLTLTATITGADGKPQKLTKALTLR